MGGRGGGMGGGGSVAIRRLYILQMVLLTGVMYCTWNGSDSIDVLGYVIMCGTGSDQ